MEYIEALEMRTGASFKICACLAPARLRIAVEQLRIADIRELQDGFRTLSNGLLVGHSDLH